MLETIQTKICSTCKIEKSILLFSKDKNKKDGFQYQCKECKKIGSNITKEQISERNRAYRKSNKFNYKYSYDKEKVAIHNKKYYLANKEKIAKQRKYYYCENKLKKQKYNKLYRLKNKEKLYDKQQLYYQINKHKISLYSREYYIQNRCLFLIKASEYRRSLFGKYVSKNSRNKRRNKLKQGDVTTKQFLELEQNTKKCYWCGISLSKVKVHIDHYMPLKLEGKHTISNLVVSCQSCNQKKSAKDPIEFANSIGRLL